MKKYIIAALALATMSDAAHAVVVKWVLQDVRFADGGLAKGSFEIDFATLRASNFDIAVAGGSDQAFGPFTYTSGKAFSNGFEVIATDLQGNIRRALKVETDQTFDQAGGRIDITTVDDRSFEQEMSSSQRLIAGGRLFGTPAAVAAVPEPATWGMMIFGFGLVGAGMRRRSTTVVAA